MDERGRWHNEDSEVMKAFKEEARGNRYEVPELVRKVIEISIGETVRVMKDDGAFVSATFDSADKNRVTLTPIEQQSPRPYLELAERVKLERVSGESVAAQVWDNRRGKLILRTLPVGQ